ncbi:unnamed protein product [Spirodela intermedia]|uniref:Uncharacterized protein n=1 Tax=Spirodela intermedia TaxID=51605 RepID=A0A7I8JI88_SPIIN|nr:unnamed protein product [Spirodela intermedia]CAA6669869.1 unnamed protein product [Spirodela intermedia]
MVGVEQGASGSKIGDYGDADHGARGDGTEATAERVAEEASRLPPEGTSAVVTLGLAIALKEEGEGLDVVVEAELAHGPEEVLGCDGLTLLLLAPLVCLAGDEADVLRHTLLDGLLRVIGDLRMRRQHPAHDPYHVRNGHKPVLLPHHRSSAAPRYCRWRPLPASLLLSYLPSFLSPGEGTPFPSSNGAPPAPTI